MKTIYVIKFKFAGSGDLVWRKVNNGVVSQNQQNDLIRFLDKKESVEGILQILEKECSIGILIRKNEKEQIFIEIIKKGENDFHIEITEGKGKKSLGTNDKNYIRNYIKEIYSSILHIVTKNEKVLILDEPAMERMYGHLIDQKCLLWVNVKSKPPKNEIIKTIIEYTMPGSQGTVFLGYGVGGSDTGDFSIRNNITNALPFIVGEIKKFSESQNTEKVFLKIKGHSRGGVAANIISNKLASVFGNNEKVEICTVSFDPVPGDYSLGNSFMTDKLGFEHEKEYEKMVLNDKIKGAVVYAVNSGYSIDFKSQKVYNYPVTIIASQDFDHSVGLYQTSVKKGSKTVKRGYNYEGKTYSPGNLHKLPNGIYWAINGIGNFTLQLITKSNYRSAIDFIESKGQENRKKFLKNLIYKKILTKEDLDAIFRPFNKDYKKVSDILKSLFYNNAKMYKLIDNILHIESITLKKKDMETARQKINDIILQYKKKSSGEIKINALKIYAVERFSKYILDFLESKLKIA